MHSSIELKKGKIIHVHLLCLSLLLFSFLSHYISDICFKQLVWCYP